MIVQFDNCRETGFYGYSTEDLHEETNDEGYCTYSKDEEDDNSWWQKLCIKYNLPSANSEYRGLLAKRAVLDSNKATLNRKFNGHNHFVASQTGTNKEVGDVYYNELCKDCEIPEDFPLNYMLSKMRNILKYGRIYVLHEAWTNVSETPLGRYCTNVNFEKMAEIPAFFKKFTEEEQKNIFRVYPTGRVDRVRGILPTIAPFFDISVDIIDSSEFRTGNGCVSSGPSINVSQCVLTRDEATELEAKQTASNVVAVTALSTNGGRRQPNQHNGRRRTRSSRRKTVSLSKKHRTRL
jgi:hypothetical protein